MSVIQRSAVTGFYNASIEWNAENERFREMIEKFGTESADLSQILWAISDDVFSAIGAEAIDEARAIPLKPQTIERKARAVKPKTKRRKGRRKSRKSRGYKVLESTSGTTVPFNNNSLTGLVAAVSSSIDDTLRGPGRRSHKSTRAPSGGLPVALRELRNREQLNWGSKRWVDYVHPHIDGTSKGLPARLSLLQPKRFEPEATERTKDVLAAILGEQLERAGAPTAWIQEVTEGRY